MDGTTYPRMNRVFLTGVAQEQPELRYTPSGVNVCSFRVQVGRLLRDRSGGSREVAAYLTVVAWQEAAQRMARELHKGQVIYVEGYVSSRSFTTARGDKRTAIEIYAEQIQILGPFQDEDQAEGASSGERERAAVPPAAGGRPGPRSREDAPRTDGAAERKQSEPSKEPGPSDKTQSEVAPEKPAEPEKQKESSDDQLSLTDSAADTASDASEASAEKTNESEPDKGSTA